MTTFGTDKNMTVFLFLTTYEIQGLCYHLLGGLQSLPKESLKFIKIYFMGGDQAEAQQRCANVHDGLDLCCIAMNNYTYTYTYRNIFNSIKTSGHNSLEKYTSHFI